MLVPMIIQKKRDGEELPSEVIREFIQGYVSGNIADYQASAFLMAVFFKGMTDAETAALTEAMMNSGDRFDPADLGGITADKHSTGGVGDKISIPLAPIVASCGVRVPMMSGRGLGHTGGTLDKLESIPGFRTNLERDEFLRVLNRFGVAMIGQTDRMVPADKKLYALRDVTATVECIPLIAASIMSKKIAAGPQNLILDVKVGRGAFMKNRGDAERLARAMVAIGTAHGRTVQARLTDMGTQPLGHMIGNSLEIIESAEFLQGRGSDDIRELTTTLAADMLIMAGKAVDHTQAMQLIETALTSGSAFKTFLEMVEAQGGDPSVVQQPYSLPVSSRTITLSSSRAGWISGIDPMALGLASVELGAGRTKKEDDIDPSVGFELLVKAGDRIEPERELIRIFYTKPPSQELLERVRNAFEFSEDKPVLKSLIIEQILPER
ncbi:thymidine phosphorylase [bacterium]|nr:thymidine phosphorylase [candidate division CSSED10-310 bacterium]